MQIIHDGSSYAKDFPWITSFINFSKYLSGGTGCVLRTFDMFFAAISELITQTSSLFHSRLILSVPSYPHPWNWLQFLDEDCFSAQSIHNVGEFKGSGPSLGDGWIFINLINPNQLVREMIDSDCFHDPWNNRKKDEQSRTRWTYLLTGPEFSCWAGVFHINTSLQTWATLSGLISLGEKMTYLHKACIIAASSHWWQLLA